MKKAIVWVRYRVRQYFDPKGWRNGGWMKKLPLRAVVRWTVKRF